METYDVAVVGGGPGGYVAAVRAAQLGLTVALVEGDHLGGTCLNRGCIPSKTLLRFAEVIELIRKARGWGIEAGEPVLSIDKMMGQKDKVIGKLRGGIGMLLKTNKIKHYEGFGTVHPDRSITVRSGESETNLSARHVILATGSKPFLPPIPGIDKTDVHTSDSIFSLSHIPKSVVIVGGGVIGVEFAGIFAGLNAKVTIVEMAPRIVATEDEDASKVLAKSLKDKGVSILTDAKVEGIGQADGIKRVTVATKAGTQELECDEVLVAVGRTPNTRGLEALGLEMNKSFVAVNEYMETSIPGIYAVGDLIGGWQLAHVASGEGLCAAANIAGHKQKMNYRVVPRCIYTSPEIASVGISVETAKQLGYQVKVEKFHHLGNGKAIAMDETEGFVKLISEEKFGEILGVVMVGPHVTEMISEAAAYMHLEGTVEELANMIHPHPAVSESLFEAANAWLGYKAH
ncbi:dihydrolipoyl dehydrogenase [Paenibacillus thalictri]|uniref:Dihydrolipoyl dehydrogenase n=1 Tax=Paenibacillus thalictri TaxID=2527873 RepID=A0A4Q9DX32_9BACL|nr:dihydrolipoyl dehydrogenase [Paenibacillus thalictri]TBL81667.1 dihydrolipoyl dehydrogenase [Paenibacillus thalictri]